MSLAVSGCDLTEILLSSELTNVDLSLLTSPVDSCPVLITKLAVDPRPTCCTDSVLTPEWSAASRTLLTVALPVGNRKELPPLKSTPRLKPCSTIDSAQTTNATPDPMYHHLRRATKPIVVSPR